MQKHDASKVADSSLRRCAE